MATCEAIHKSPRVTRHYKHYLGIGNNVSTLKLDNALKSIEKVNLFSNTIFFDTNTQAEIFDEEAGLINN